MKLLNSIGYKPDLIVHPNIDEKIYSGEKPYNAVMRISDQKASIIKKKYDNYFIIAADTVAYSSNKILGKPKNAQEAQDFIIKLSGRRHKVYTGFTIITPEGLKKTRFVLSRVILKKLSTKEIEEFLSSKTWSNKAGAYSLQGFASRYIKFISGSYSNIIGLPLHEVYLVLNKFIN